MKKFLVLALALGVVLPMSASAAQVYTNREYKVSLNYSGLNMQTTEVGGYIPAPGMTEDSNATKLLSLYLKPSIYKGTTLESASFNLLASKNVDETTCYDNALAGVMYNQIRRVQGNRWHYANPNPRGGAGAGHTGNTETYRLYKNSTCYQVTLHTSAMSDGTDTGKVKYSEKRVFNRLGAVFNRLKVK